MGTTCLLRMYSVWEVLESSLVSSYSLHWCTVCMLFVSALLLARLRASLVLLCGLA
jgi:hypothetical protein